MAWNKAQLIAFWNSYINTNGAQGITGALLNEGGTEIINAMRLESDQIDAFWREPTATGYIYGGLLTEHSATEVKAAYGGGYIMDSYTNPIDPQAQSITWETQTLAVTAAGPAGAGILSIDDAGDLNLHADISPALRRQEVVLGAVQWVDNVITDVYNVPNAINQTANDLKDFVEFFDLESRKKGMLVSPVTSALSIWHSSGIIFILGSNYRDNNLNPNQYATPQLGNSTTPYAFDVILNDGTVYATAQTVIPNYYDDGAGGVTSLGTNKATIFYVHRVLGGKIYLQPSTIQYDSGALASAALVADRSVLIEPSSLYLLWITEAQIWMQQPGATDFSDPALAGISNLGQAAGGGGGGGGGSTDYINAASFNTGNGSLALTGVGLAGASTNLDGRYALDSDLDAVKWLVKVDQYDDTAEYLEDKITAGTGLQITRVDQAGGSFLFIELVGSSSYTKWIAAEGGDEWDVLDEDQVNFIAGSGMSIETNKITDQIYLTFNNTRAAGQWSVITGGISYLSKVVIGSSTVYTEDFAVQGDVRTTGHHRAGTLEVDGAAAFEAQAKFEAIRTVTANTTTTNTDHTVVCNKSGSACAVTLQAATSTNKGQILMLTDISGDGIGVASTYTPYSTLVSTGDGGCIQLQSTGSTWVLIGGHGITVA